jgi:hypothetical protein
MKIIYVHGIAQETKSSRAVQDEWDDAFRAGLANAGETWPSGVNTVAPFYGRTLADKRAEADRGEAIGLIRRGNNAADNAKKFEFFDEFLTDVAKSKGVQADELVGDDGRPIERGVLNWKWVNGLVRRLNRFEAIANLSIETFTRDVWCYLNYTFVREPVNAHVKEAIPQDERCVVVSHSLGTVVCYNVLHKRAVRENIVAWITLGSPLGVEAIYRRLPSAGGNRPAPAGVGAWYNARDPEDVVALHPIPADMFAGDPVVENASHVDNQTSNEHGISGYLSDAEVARRICRAARD